MYYTLLLQTSNNDEEFLFNVNDEITLHKMNYYNLLEKSQ